MEDVVISSEDMTRRGFLGKTAAAAISGGIAATADSFAARTGASPSERPFVTGVPGKKLVGCYVSAGDILDSPEYIDALQKKLGVNVLLCSNAIKMPQWLRDMHPLKEQGRMIVSHFDDDSRLNRAIEETHKRGMDFWLYFSGHHYGTDVHRPYIAETFDGVKFMDLPQIKYALCQSLITTCFSKPAIRDWDTAVFSYAAGAYDVDSMYVSHYRYANPSFWTNLFGCACRDCQKEAARQGYDYESMKRAMLKLRYKLERLDKKTLERAAEMQLHFTDFLTMLGDDNGVMDWFVFRANVVGDALKRIHDSVHTETNHRSGFITDTHNSTHALFVGHNWKDLICGGSDALHPLSWCAYQHISAVAAWANQLCEWVPGLSEETAMNVVMRFFGWDNLGLPDKRIKDLRIGVSSKEHGIYDAANKDGFYGYFNPDLTIKLMTHEWSRMSVINGGRIPAHPVIKGYEWPENVCRELMDVADELGLTGYVFQRTDVFIDREKL